MGGVETLTKRPEEVELEEGKEGLSPEEIQERNQLLRLQLEQVDLEPEQRERLLELLKKEAVSKSPLNELDKERLRALRRRQLEDKNWTGEDANELLELLAREEAHKER